MGEVVSLGPIVADWIQRNAVIPDREDRGRWFILTREQKEFLNLFYLLDVETKRWVYERGAQLVRPQKAGKGPLAAAIVCAEAVGPVRPVWDGHELVDGRAVPTAHIQITACSEDQAANTWRALQPMIELGPLGETMIPDTGLTRINLPGGGLIEPVTASARSRLGQRITFAVEDETHGWLQSNHGWQLADNQRRNLAGTGGRFMETTNAWDPVESSVAQRTFEAKDPHVLRDYAHPPAGSVRNKVERRKVMRAVYGDALVERGGWVDLDRIDVEVEVLLEHDPGQAERFFLNRAMASEGAAFDFEAWKQLEKRRKVQKSSTIVIGVDGARHDDALAVVAVEVKTGYVWPLGVWERPEDADEDYRHPQREVDGAVREAFERFNVWRLYADPQYIGSLLEGWQNEFGEKRVVEWATYRPRQIAWAVRNFEQAISAGDLSHDGNEVLSRHVRNSRRRKLTVLDDKERVMHTLSKDSHRSPRKIDAAMAAVLAWEARGDCIAAGGQWMGDDVRLPQEPRPQKWSPGVALPARELVASGEAPPLGQMS